MSMSKQNYVALAAIIRNQWDEAHQYAQDVEHADGVFVLQELVKELTDYLAEDNERFDRKRFLAAAIDVTGIENQWEVKS